jgi:pSer/pThr/pTyr-binding forkhead associated (FHA) protein
MSCTLTIVSGPAAGGSVVVKEGEATTVGRSKNATVVIVEDPSLSGVHFSVKCEAGACVIQDLGSTNKMFINYECVSRATLKHGDVIQAGESQFEVAIVETASEETPSAEAGKVISATAVSPPPAKPAAEPEPLVGFLAPTALGVIERFGLKEDPELAADDKWSSEKLIEQLQQQQKLVPALKYLAYALPKRSAVWWSCQCVRQAGGEALKPDDRAALESAEAWVANPSEDNRRAAMAVADKQKHATAACWANVGAFWSGGSMAPPASPVIPPAEDLTGKAIFGAVQLAAVAQQPEKAAEKHKKFISLGLAVSRGENTWAPSASGKK